MQAKKTNPEKTKNPEMLTLDSTYPVSYTHLDVYKRQLLALAKPPC